jgi:hypothetical protein
MRVEEVCMRAIKVIIFVLGIAVVLCGSAAKANLIGVRPTFGYINCGSTSPFPIR